MKTSVDFIERIFDIRRQEVSRVLLMSTYLLLIIAAYSTSKAVRDSLFVTQIGTSQLPYVYLLIAGAMGVVSLVYTRAVARTGLHRLIRITSLIAISNLMLFWLMFRQNSAIWFYVLYVWVSLFGAITASQFWLLATHVFDAREARRVFAWIGVGGILGGILGGGITNRVANWVGTESLLLLCAAMMASTIVLLERVASIAGSHAREESVSVDTHETLKGKALFRKVRESRHLTMLVLLLSVAVVVEAFIDYQYKFVAKQSFSSKDQLTAFFGSITFYIGIFSLLFQMFVTNRILKRFGVAWAILMLPAGLLISFLALAAHPNLWAAALLQLVDGGLSYSIHRSGMELLYLPIPPQTRNAVKGFIDMFVDRAGRAIGAVLLLVLTVVLSFSIPSLSLVGAGLVVAWIAMIIVVKHEYLHSFRQALEKTTVEPGELQLRNLDRATIQPLLKLLTSSDERRVLYALDLLSNTHPNRWRDQINVLIRHPSSAVRARTIAVLAAWNDPSIAREEFVHHTDYETARVATAGALRLNWTGSFDDRRLLGGLLKDRSQAVVRQAMATAGLVKYDSAIPILIDRLGDRALRQDARAALVRFDRVVIPDLARHLLDAEERIVIRTRIPKVLALTGRREAAAALLRSLHRCDYHLDYAVLKALNRMRVNYPKLVFDRECVTRAIYTEREAYDRLKQIRVWLDANVDQEPISCLLVRAVSERQEQRLERIFRLLALNYAPDDIYAVYYNCQVRPAMRASAIEFLDNLLETDVKRLVMPLLEETNQKLTISISRHAVFETLLNPKDPWLSMIATEFVSREARDECVNAG
jgi:ATP/ADP translocase